MRTIEQMRDSVARGEYSKAPGVDRQIRREERILLEERFMFHLEAAIKYELHGRLVNGKQAGGLARFAWQEGHSNGLHEVLYIASDLIEALKS